MFWRKPPFSFFDWPLLQLNQMLCSARVSFSFSHGSFSRIPFSYPPPRISAPGILYYVRMPEFFAWPFFQHSSLNFSLYVVHLSKSYSPYRFVPTLQNGVPLSAELTPPSAFFCVDVPENSFALFIGGFPEKPFHLVVTRSVFLRSCFLHCRTTFEPLVFNVPLFRTLW